MTQAPTAIHAAEQLGRGVFSAKDAKRAARSKIPHRVFLTKPGVVRISVDRLNLASASEIVTLAIDRAENRPGRFHGWAVLSVDKAIRKGRRVESTPAEGNPHHADIVLPDPAREDRDAQIAHARDMADASNWKPRPEATSRDS